MPGSFLRLPVATVLVALTLALLGGSMASAQDEEPRRPSPVSAEALAAAIDKLGDLDYPTRTAAARTVRRVPGAQAVPALIQAVSEHADGYVRFRALVLLTGFNDPRAKETMLRVMADPNDRLRTVAYAYFEFHPDPKQVPALLAALEPEVGEFVRPALVRALAASATGNPAVRETLKREVGRGQDYFRSAVIEALGDYKADYAFEPLLETARLEGPLQIDAVLALGKIGDKRALPTFADLQRTAPRQAQPAVAAAICLLGINCSSHLQFLTDTLRFAEKNPGYAELMRGAASGLGAIATQGHVEALSPLLEIGAPSEDPVRAATALAVATVALRNTPFFLEAVGPRADRAAGLALAAEGFDMLEEDFAEERFFAAVRRLFWDSPDASPARQLAEALIRKLEF